MANTPLTAQAYKTAILAYLHQIDPDISTNEGDPITLIVQAVAMQLADSDLNYSSLDNFMDLTMKTGSDLDGFGNFFGFQRWSGTPATVQLNFYSPTPIKTGFIIEQGTQVTDGTHVFQTTSTATFPTGSTSIEVPAQSVGTGAVYNVQAYTLIYLEDNLNNSLVYVQNLQAATGGTDQETDEHFRNRIQQNLFHRIIGTKDSYQSLAETIDDTTRAKAISALNTYVETSEIVQLSQAYGGSLGYTSTIGDAKYVYPNSSYLIKNPGDSTQTDYVQNVQYVFNTSINPKVPTYQIQDQSLGSALDSYSGPALDALGKEMGLNRYVGTPTTGTMQIALTFSSINPTVIPAGTEFYYATATATYTYQTLAAVTIKPETFYSPTVAYQSTTMGSFPLPNLANVEFETNANIFGVIQTCTGGTSAWTDDQYRSQLADLYANNIGLNQGDIVYSQFDYCSAVSRNNPPQDTNCLDLFIDGTASTTTTETGIVNLTEITSANQTQFIQVSGNYPVLGTKIQILGTGNIENLGGVVTVNGTNYPSAQLIKCNTLLKDSIRAVNALMFPQNSSLPSNGQTYSVPLIENKAVNDTQAKVETVRTMGTDVLVHAGKNARLNINLVIDPLVGTPNNTLVSNVEALLSAYFANLNFGSIISFSKIIDTISQSAYVRSVRFATVTDNGTPDIAGGTVNTGITVNNDWGNPLAGTYIDNFKLFDNMYPSLGDLNIALEGDNTYVNSYSATNNQSGSGSGTNQGGGNGNIWNPNNPTGDNGQELQDMNGFDWGWLGDINYYIC